MSRTRMISMLGILALLVAADARVGTAAPPERQAKQPAARTVDKADVDRLLSSWPAKPRAVAYLTIKKYGLPQEATASHLTWFNNGPWKRTVLSRKETPHHFPKPHTDLLEQVIDFKVPPDKFDELAKFDGSIIVERTKGELSARCDREEMNFLALNLANDIVTGKITAAEARAAYTQNVMAFMTEPQPPAYTAGLRFDHPRRWRGDPDVITIAGAPRPAPAGEIQRVRGEEEAAPSDANILAILITANAGEVERDGIVAQTTRDPEVKRFAEKLKNDHARALKTVMALGPRADITPIENVTVVMLQENGAKGLADLAQKEGKDFDRAFIDMTVKNHTRTLALIDDQLLPSAKNPEVKRAAQHARKIVAAHLEEAKRLQAARR